MDAKEFKKLLELLNKGKKEEAEKETVLKSQAKIRAHRGKTFFEIAMEENRWIREILNHS